MNTFIAVTQLIFTVVIGLYFLMQILDTKSADSALKAESKKELEKISKLEKISLTKPLSEITRPTSANEIIGQNDGIKALTCAICSKNPKHVIIYGPCGVGKTAAARVILEKAKKMGISPFKSDAKFIEADATTMRSDERSIADPLIGSVHDPIYQGASFYGSLGIPQIKLGAVSKAHGGVLFLDEIGELSTMQLNRLLKVLEDSRVFFESAYYSSEDKNIPPHIHKIFKEGYPADFRLIGATTRSPEEIPDAVRSRCTEIFFNPLTRNDICRIVKNAILKSGFLMEEGGENLISLYAKNGRDAVNIVEMCINLVEVEARDKITLTDIEWVVQSQKYFPIYFEAPNQSQKEGKEGVVNALCVTSFFQGAVMEIECTIKKCDNKNGSVKITGIITEQDIEYKNGHYKKPSDVKNSVENAITVIKSIANFEICDYNIHINFPGFVPVDGPSAGAAIFLAIYSAFYKKRVLPSVAITGELSIHGLIKRVGGVYEKIEAAKKMGIKKVIIPCENYLESHKVSDIEIVPVNNVFDIIKECFPKEGDLHRYDENVIRSAKKSD